MKHWMTQLAICLLALGALAPVAANASQRVVFVNGQRMTPQQLVILDRMQCAYIPNGNYWLNVINGAWGYQGNPFVQGYLGQACRGYGGGNQRGRSLSERGLLYTPGDLNFR